MTTRLLCYSLTGHTRSVAREIADRIGAVPYEIDAPGPAKPGMWSIVRLAFTALFHRPQSIRVPDINWADGDLLIIGTPVWAGRVSSPVRAWLDRRPALPDRVAFLVTSGDPRRPDDVFRELARLTGRVPVAELHVSEAMLTAGDTGPAIAEFCGRLRPAPTPAQALAG